MENLIVFTGGPGSGKTSVINHLKELGYECAPRSRS
ncbi:AAA family ATPase [Endozoicomonas sp. ALD040]